MKPVTFNIRGKECIALIRKLMEKECGRLMGVDDADIDKIAASGVSRSAQYKLYGNSIVVDVLYHLFRKLLVEPGNDTDQMSIFDLCAGEVLSEYNREHPLRVVTLCSGYDSQCLAFERLKRHYPDFDYELVAWSEFDPETPNVPLEKQPAVIAHNALFPQWAGRNLGDMTKIDRETVPDFDMLFYSTPCQSISQAGLQHGFVEGSGTRSSIIWDVRDALMIKRPKFACLENVAAMVSQKFLPMFNLWRDAVRDMGYSNFAQVLNAKDYGVPQNRERIFLMSIYDPTEELHYNFPAPMPLEKKLNDVLEDEADVKYYLNPNRVNQFVKDNLVKITSYAESSDEKIEPLPQYLRDWLESFPEQDISDAEIEAALEEKAYEAENGVVGDLSYPHSRTRRGRVQEGGTVVPTLTCEGNNLFRITIYAI